MAKKAQKIRLGIFILISSTILLLVLGLFTAKEFFKKEDTYYISYEDISVSGLEVGSPVKYMGVKAGTVADIHIDPEDVSNIIVEVSLKPGTPVKEDARADITSVGITGLKTIEIRGGSNEAESLEPGEYIPAGSSITKEITGKAEIIAEKAEAVLNNLQTFTRPENLDKFAMLAADVSRLAIKTGQTINTIDTLIAENRLQISQTVNNTRQVSERLNESSKLIQESVIKINRLVEGDTLSQILANARDVSVKLREAEVGELINNLAEVAGQTHKLLLKIDDDLDRNSQDFSESLILLKRTLENLNEASRKINENPSILLRGVNTKNIPDEKLRR